MTRRFAFSGPLRGSVRVAGDKSISHRAAILGAMSSGPVRIDGYLDAADTNSTLSALAALGASVRRCGDRVVITGCGMRGARAPAGVIDVGNAGTLMRLLPGWLASQEGRSFTLDGDSSIRRRPIDRIAQPLARMGAKVSARDGRFAPFTVTGARLKGIDYELPVASAQVKSCVLLAGLATESTSVLEPAPARDHTERMLAAAGVTLHRQRLAGGGVRVTVGGVSDLALERIEVPADLSSAAFVIAAAVLVPGSRVRLERVGLNWTRAGFIRILRRMGARVEGELEAEGTFAASEPVGELEVFAGELHGTTVEEGEVPLAIDELPLVALAGCFAQGETVVRGAGELRVKESDRIAAVVDGLRGLGARVEALQDGFVVSGTGGLRGGALDARGDHRLALLGAVAGLACRNGVQVAGFESAAVSYPGFVDDLALLLEGGT